jgi:plasmid maintenance system killer protein
LIRGFRGKFAEAILIQRNAPKGFPADLLKVTRRKLVQLNGAEALGDLASPPGNMLQVLKEALVHLGEIPFVRLRDGLPKRLLEGHAPFSEAVAEAQKALPPVALTLDPAKHTVIAADKSLALEPMQFAFYWMMAERCRTARGGVRRDDGGVVAELLEYYGRLVNYSSGIYERAEKAYRNFGMENFDQTKTKVNRAVKRALGERLAAPYLIVKLDPIAGNRIHPFGLSLPPGSVTIAASLPA